MTEYTDSHCHITCDELYEDIDGVIERAREAGVTRMMIMCTSKEELERALPLKEKHPDLFRVAFGWFPEEAKTICTEDLEYLENLAASGKIDVLGEIGLDYYWDDSYKEEQKDLFRKQIEIANRHNLPIAIHMRDASGDCMEILKALPKTKIIFHCYSGSTETMKEALKLDSLISFAGPITYKNNKTGPQNVIACPPERMLTETDAPYLSPVPKRGKRNEPANVRFTAAKAAELKGMDEDELCRQIQRNFDSIFESCRT